MKFFFSISLTFFIVFSITQFCYSQVPKKFNYQAVARNVSGNILSNQVISIKAKYHAGSPIGNVSYWEIFRDTTNQFGLFNVELGATPTGIDSGSFTAIPFASQDIYLEIGLDATGGSQFLSMGTTQFISVPYALIADTVLHSPNASSFKIFTDNTLSGTGTINDPLKIAEQGVINGQVLKWNDSTWLPGNVSSGNSGWSLIGNSGTNPSTNFIGTTDNQSLTFKVNSQKAGLIDKDNELTFFGYQAGLNNSSTLNYNSAFGSKALYSNTTGEGNVANGGDALYSNTTGIHNTGIGTASLYSNSIGNYNTAIGSNTLYSNLTGNENTACGYTSLFSNTTGYQNAALGERSLNANTTGYFNTACGQDALSFNTAGHNNTALGQGALYLNEMGSENTASGSYSLNSNTSGNQNTAVGDNSLLYNITGNGNTAIGYNSLKDNTAGSNNIAIGYNAGVSTDGLTNATAIGYNSKVGTSNTLVLGGIGVDAVNVGIGITTPVSKLQVSNGDVYIDTIASGIILKSPDGSCWRITIDDTGSLLKTKITCP